MSGKTDVRVKIVGYCRINSKKYVMYVDQSCSLEEVKITDGFHDKVISCSDEQFKKTEILDKGDIDLERIVKRTRGARPWHPLLKALREEMSA